MDSLTQATLGAVIGEIAFGKQLGWRAALWGAIAGSMPDMDVFANPWLETHERMRWHRGPSHALPGLILGTGIAAAWIHFRKQIPWRPALIVSFLVIGLNILIDCFNTYGTQIYEPFSEHRVSWNLLFIIDPLFTVPLLLGLICALIIHPRHQEWGQRCMLIGVGLCLSYLCIATINKQRVNSLFEESLAQQGHTIEEWFSSPTAFNTVYWRCLAKTKDGYLIGYACADDDLKNIPWEYISAQHELITHKTGTAAFDTVRWSSTGYWIARSQDDGRILLTDIRFGDNWLGRAGQGQLAEQGVWNYYLSSDDKLEHHYTRDQPIGESLNFIWQRIWGNVQSGR